MNPLGQGLQPLSDQHVQMSGGDSMDRWSVVFELFSKATVVSSGGDVTKCFVEQAVCSVLLEGSILISELHLTCSSELEMLATA